MFKPNYKNLVKPPTKAQKEFISTICGTLGINIRDFKTCEEAQQFISSKIDEFKFVQRQNTSLNNIYDNCDHEGYYNDSFSSEYSYYQN